MQVHMQDKMRHPNLRHATCGIIILYNPDIPLLLKNIAGSSAQVERLYLIDNTENNDRYAETLQTIANVSHLTLGRNTGIAHALNEGCRLALEAGFKWAVTLDQDSVLPAGYIDACSRFLENKACHRIGHSRLLLQYLSCGMLCFRGIGSMRRCNRRAVRNLGPA